MSEVQNWTNLPKGMDQDFVSCELDYDYPLYLSEKPEWVNLKNVKGKVIISEPFLIMELNRFVPYLEEQYVKFHPLNMPNVKIGKIEIVGFVLYVSEDANFYEYRVDDGTGAISIFVDRKNFVRNVEQRERIDDKYRKWAAVLNMNELKIRECPTCIPKSRPRFDYPAGASTRDIAIFEHNWSVETNNGSLGENIKQKEYVHALGYCMLDFMFGEKPKDEITFRNLSQAKINFYATKVIRINEHDYNKKLYTWINTTVRRRYDEHSSTPKSASQNESSRALVQSQKF